MDLVKTTRGKCNSNISFLHQKLGPVVRLGPSEISVNSSSGLSIIYAGGFEKHGSYQWFVNYGTTNLVTMREHDAHSTQKRMISHVSLNHICGARRICRRCPAFFFSIHSSRCCTPRLRRINPEDILNLAKSLGMNFTSCYLFLAWSQEPIFSTV